MKVRDLHYYLYKITNWFNGKIYIGVHKTNDSNDSYMGSGKILKAAIEKYGAGYFTKEILQQFNSAEEMFEAESQIVNEEFVKDEGNYNIRLGGFGGWDYINSQLTKEERSNRGKISGKIHKEKLILDLDYRENFKKRSSETIKRTHASGKIKYDTFTGKHHSEDTKKKIGMTNSTHQSGSGNSNFGKCWIYNLDLKESKSIPKDELDQWLASGWIKGRKQNF